MTLTRESQAARTTALTRLALATREKVEPAVYVLYVEDTASYSTDVVVMACRRLETRLTWFPKIAELVDECRIVATRQQEAKDEAARQRLRPPPLPADRWAAFQAQFQAIIQQKVMK